MLTISLLSLPQRSEYKIVNGILAYLLNESFFFLILQQFSFIIVTVCLIRIPSMILDILFKEITLTKTASTNEVVELVAKWKENWLVVCDLVVDVNNFIGWPLILYIILGFYIFVSYNFLILFRFLEIEQRHFLSYGISMYLILKFFACFCLLAFAAEKLPLKVNCLINVDTGRTAMNRVFNWQVSNILNQLKHVKVSVYAVQNQVSLR